MMDYVLIKDIRPGQKNINVVFIILEVGHPTITKENREVRTFKVADSTACMNVSIWDEPGQLLVPGDIVKLTKGYASVWRQCLTLYSGKNGDIQKIGEFCMVINEQMNMSEPNPALAQQLVNQSGGNSNNSSNSGTPTGNNINNINNKMTNNGNSNNILPGSTRQLGGDGGGSGTTGSSNTTTTSTASAASNSTKIGSNGSGGGAGNSTGHSATASKNSNSGKTNVRGAAGNKAGYRNGGRGGERR